MRFGILASTVAWNSTWRSRTASVGSIDHREMINPALPGGREIGFQNRQAAFATDGLQECATAYTGEVPQCYIVPMSSRT